MRIKEINLQNFLSFKDTKITLTENNDENPTIYIIDGINYDADLDESSSNGSGKSTIIGESIMYNIYGKGLRGNKQKVKLNEMVRNGTSKMSNSVKYLINNNDNKNCELIIDRTKTVKGTSTVNIDIDGETKTKRTKRLSDKDIKMFIDLTPETFIQSIVYYKDNINLMSMNYGQRLDFFKNMVDLSIIDNYYEKVKDFKQLNEKALDKLYLIEKNTKDIISIVDENKDEYIKYLNKILDENKKELEKAESIIIPDKSKYKEEMEIKKDDVKKIEKELDKYKKKITIDRNNIDKIDNEIKKFNKLSGIKCPTCKQLVTNEYIESISKTYIEEKENLTISVNNYTDIINNLNKEYKIKNKELDLIINKINEINTQIKLKEQKVNNIKNEIKKIEKDINNSIKKENKVDKSKFELKLIGIKNAIKIRKEWDIANNYWYNIFSPKSLLRSTIIRKYITHLSDLFEIYLSKLYNNDILARITIDDDGNIEPQIFYNGYETNYFQLSSGERKRIDIALTLSLYEFISYLNPNIPKFLILDELFDSLDQIGINSVVNTLIEIQNRHKIDLYLISHIPIPIEMIPKDTVVKKILVTKKNKISNVKYLK